MLKPRKRLTKKEIKQDKLVITAVKVTTFVQENTKLVTLSILGLILVVLISTVSLRYRADKQTKALDMLAEASSAEQSNNISMAMDLYRKVTKNYSGTLSAGRAYIALGNILFEQGEYLKAISTYQTYIKDYGGDSIVEYNAVNGINACKENLGKYLEAARGYKGYADKNPDSAFAPRVLLDAARCFSLAGKNEEAKAALQKVLDTYPKSTLASKARDELGSL